jgi:acetyl-CoA carboxylase biotin carboxyl carrier protein
MGRFSQYPPSTLRTLELEKIEKLVALLQDSDLSELEVEDDSGRLRLAKAGPALAYHAPLPAAAAPAATAAPTSSAGATGSAAEEEGMLYIKSPMVGTFYSAPSPDSPAYVENGAKVGPETVVCIIEAMKVMNEIQAECKGVVVEALVENGDAVEYGQPLFKVRPS